MAIKVTENRRGGVAVVGLAVKTAETTAPLSAPTVTSGSGVPATTEPNGSLYLRTNGTNADTALYVRVSGSWVAIKGAT